MEGELVFLESLSKLKRVTQSSKFQSIEPPSKFLGLLLPYDGGQGKNSRLHRRPMYLY